MSALENEKTYYEEKAAELVDALDKLRCLSIIEQWYAAQIALNALQSNDIASYSIGGRSLTRKNIPDLERSAASLLQEIHAILFRRGYGLADLRSYENR